MQGLSPRSLFIVFLVIVLSLFYLQSLFNDSDHHKSELWVRTYTAAPGGPTLEQWLDGKYPEAHGGVWSSTVISSCHGYMRVTWDAQTKDGPREWVFDVDIPEHRIHPDPGNALGRDALVKFAAAATPSPAPTSAPAGRSP